MNKAITAAAILIVLVLGGAYAADMIRNNPVEENVVVSPEALYFQDRLITLGIEEVGRPIEGFDSSMLMMAFPGLMNTDFDGVASFEGKYIVKGDTLEYVRDTEAPITSAERTVSEEGYVVLLENVSKRLGIEVKDVVSIDVIVAALNTSDLVAVRIGEAVQALGVTIAPTAVLEDSRCPEDVQCIQAGTVRVAATLESGLGAGKETFVLNQPITTEAEEVVLERVEPAPKATVKIEPADYLFYFRVTKR